MAAAPGLSPRIDVSVLRFGVFELDTERRELRRQGIKVRLQTQPVLMLLTLLERPGEIVSREDLRRRLWSEDTFVDFDRSLNSAANRLRIALGDAAENPRFIETVAGLGYRFIAPVNSPVAGAPVARVIRKVWLWPAVAAALVTVILTWVAIRPVPQREFRYRAVTFGRGQVTAATFTGESDIVYSARWDNRPARLFLTNFRSPESRPLGTSPVEPPVTAGRLAPVHWSRDGKWLFVQHLDSVLPAKVSKLHVRTGEMRPLKDILPADRFGVNSVTGIVIAADEQHYAYSCRRVQSSLFAAETR